MLSKNNLFLFKTKIQFILVPILLLQLDVSTLPIVVVVSNLLLLARATLFANE
jgi:hypothetical protein